MAENMHVGPLMDRNLVVRRVREKEADVPWFLRKANRALLQGLTLLHVGTGRPLEWAPLREGLRSLGKKVNSAGLRAPRN